MDHDGKEALAKALKDSEKSNFKLDSFSVPAFANSDVDYHEFFDDLLFDGRLDIVNKNTPPKTFSNMHAFVIKTLSKLPSNRPSKTKISTKIIPFLS